jgi:dihydrofolate reductase
MRKVIYGGACSLDGYLAGKDEAMDWLRFSKDVEAVMRKTWANADTVLVGRKTWEFASKMGGGPEMPGVTGYVFSRTLTSLPNSKDRLVTTDAAEFVRKLKSQPGKDMVVMSGGNFAASLMQHDLIDEIGFNIHPVLLGGGVPAFLDLGRRINLKLTECRALTGDCVLVTYQVVRG